jgi:SH3-like domain-containing protein
MVSSGPSYGFHRLTPLLRGACVVACACFLGLTPVFATEDTAQNPGAPAVEQMPQTDPARGSATNLPLPRFVSLKANEANVRRGPSLSHRIDWVFTQRNYPLEVIAEYGHWRRVRDMEGATGWLHYSLISGVRTALVTDGTVDLFSRPDTGSRLAAQAEKGVILRLLECNISWCKVSASGYKGWVLKSGLWGVRSNEILE